MRNMGYPFRFCFPRPFAQARARTAAGGGQTTEALVTEALGKSFCQQNAESPNISARFARVTLVASRVTRLVTLVSTPQNA